MSSLRYGAMAHCTWPCTYNVCEVGTVPNQSFANSSGSDSAKVSQSAQLACTYVASNITEVK